MYVLCELPGTPSVYSPHKCIVYGLKMIMGMPTCLISTSKNTTSKSAPKIAIRYIVCILSGAVSDVSFAK